MEIEGDFDSSEGKMVDFNILRKTASQIIEIYGLQDPVSLLRDLLGKIP